MQEGQILNLPSRTYGCFLTYTDLESKERVQKKKRIVRKLFRRFIQNKKRNSNCLLKVKNFRILSRPLGACGTGFIEYKASYAWKCDILEIFTYNGNHFI